MTVHGSSSAMGKISTNTNLKRRIREFQSKHGVPHSIALWAVDEPLHRLRDLSRLPETAALTFVRKPLFRLVGDAGPFSPMVEDSAYGEFIRNIYLENSFAEYSPAKIIKKISLRAELLKVAAARDLWELRELKRAGFLEISDSPKALGELLEIFDDSIQRKLFEPIFYYYSGTLDSLVSSRLSKGEGARLGIFPVNLSRILAVGDAGSAFPVTLKELNGLRDGTLQEKLKHIQQINLRPGVSVERKVYSGVALLKGVDPRHHSSQLRVFFGDPNEKVDTANAKLVALGMDPSLYEIYPLSSSRFEVSLEGDYIRFTDIRKRRDLGSGGSSARVLELDGDLALARFEEVGVDTQWLRVPAEEPQESR